MMRRTLLVCAGFALLCWAEMVTGALQGADTDPLRDATHNSLMTTSRERKQQAQPQPDRPAASVVTSTSTSTSTSSRTAGPDMVVQVRATTKQGLRCKPAECKYDTTQSPKGRLRGDNTWSLAAVDAGVFANKGAIEHFLHLVKLCHTMKGAFAAAHVGATYDAVTGKVDIVLHYSSSEARLVEEFAGQGASLNARISALLADALVMHEAPVAVDAVTVLVPAPVAS